MKKGFEFIEEEAKNLLRVLSYRKFDFAVDACLKILEEQFGARFYRVTEWPQEIDRLWSNFIVIDGPDDVKVSIADPRTKDVLRSYGCEVE